MAKEIVKVLKPWKYEDSVAIAKPLVAMYNRVSLDLVRELYAARIALSSQGQRTDVKNKSTSCQMAISSQTWLKYLSDIRLPQRTAYNWLSLYSPKEDKLYTPDEYKTMLEDLFKKVKDTRKTKYGWEPEGWTPILERKYQKWLSLENVLETVEQKGYEQAELFSREYLNLLAHQLEDDPTPDEILHFDALCNEYASKIDGSIKVEKPMTIVQMVEKAVSILDKEEQSKVMKSVVVVLNDLSIHMENEK